MQPSVSFRMVLRFPATSSNPACSYAAACDDEKEDPINLNPAVGGLR